jgi:raffinose/stachyose/melibiose transport system permease protein
VNRSVRSPVRSLFVHLTLGGYSLLVLFPILLVLVNSFKTRRAIFDDPLGLPTAATLSVVGYAKVLGNASIGGMFANSVIVTGCSLVLILLLGAMAAWALTEYRFPGNRLLALFLAFGIMVPIRLGSVSILQTMVALDLVNTLTALVLVYVAQGLPLAILILSEFIRQVPGELKDAQRLVVERDGPRRTMNLGRLVDDKRPHAIGTQQVRHDRAHGPEADHDHIEPLAR